MPERFPLAAIERALGDLPRPSFRARLKAELTGGTTMTTATESVTALRQTAAPRLRVKNAHAAIDFYTRAFGARELMRFEAHGRIAHAEVAIGNSVVMLGEAAAEYGFPDPHTLGGSSVAMHLYVDDVNAWVERAAAAGATIVVPVSDQFYGDRSGSVVDPFGYTWEIATRQETLTREEMQQLLAALEAQRPPRAEEPVVPEGFHAVTPYLVVDDAPALIEFTKSVFGAEEVQRGIGSAGGVHATLRMEDSMLMIGGGGPGLAFKATAMPTALHVYVPDCDATYRRALAAGATSIGEPVDQEYGERSCGIKDASGTVWYVATCLGGHHIPPGLQTVNAYLHPRRAEPLIRFLQRGMGATRVEQYTSHDGVVLHAQLTIGDTVVEMGEAHGPYQPMPTMFHVYVPDVDASYRRALQAGAASISEPADQPYGNRTAGVRDPFGNQWYFATPTREARQS
jgi:PhnB protein